MVDTNSVDAGKVRKVLNFDLDTNKLKEIFSDYTLAYGKMRKALTDEGFEHRQGSGYISKEPLDIFEIYDKMERVATKNPWLSMCMNEFDVSDIPLNIFSLKDMIRGFTEEK